MTCKVIYTLFITAVIKLRDLIHSPPLQSFPFHRFGSFRFFSVIESIANGLLLYIDPM